MSDGTELVLPPARAGGSVALGEIHAEAPPTRGSSRGGQRSSRRRARARRARRRRMILRIALGAAALGTLLLGVSAYYAKAAERDLKAARADMQVAKAQLSALDGPGAIASIKTARASAARAQHELDALPVRMLATLPYAGRSFRAARSLARSTGSVVDAIDATLTSAKPLLDSVRDHHVDLASVDWGGLAVAADSVAKAFDTALASERSAPHSLVLPPIRSAQRAFDAQISKAQRSAARLAAGLRVAAGMLGGNGARDNLVVIENDAEPRAVGGAPNDFVLLHADRGHVRMVRAEDDAKLPQAQFDMAFRAGISPDFPDVATKTAGLYSRARGVSAGSVTYVDGSALARLLNVTGPIRVGSETLTGPMVATYLARDIFIRHPDLADREVFNASLASQLFHRLLHGHLDLKRFGAVISDLSATGHVKMWSRAPVEQDALQKLGVAGGFPYPTDDRTLALVGNNAYSNKLGAYEYRTLDYHVTIHRDGSCSARATVTIRNAVDPAGLPEHVVGTPRGVLHTDLSLWAFAGDPRTIHADVPAGTSTTRAFAGDPRCAPTPGEFTFVLWHQPRLNPDRLVLEIDLPTGASVRAIEGLPARVTGSVVRWSGALDRDGYFAVTY